MGFLALEAERRKQGLCVGCGQPKSEPHLPDCWTLKFERDLTFGTEYDDSDGAA